MIASELQTSLSDDAVADFDALIEYLFSFGRQMIDQFGELAPFGAVVRPSGELEPLGVDPRPGRKVQDALERLEGSVSEGSLQSLRGSRFTTSTGMTHLLARTLSKTLLPANGGLER